MKTLTLIIGLFLLSIGSFGQGKHSDENTTQRLTLKCKVEKLYSLAFTTAMESSWKIVSSTPTVYSFSATTPKTMKRWDDDVNVFVKQDNDSISILTVKSNLGHKPNVEYIQEYLKKIEIEFSKSPYK